MNTLLLSLCPGAGRFWPQDDDQHLEAVVSTQILPKAVNLITDSCLKQGIQFIKENMVRLLESHQVH